MSFSFLLSFCFSSVTRHGSGSTTTYLEVDTVNAGMGWLLHLPYLISVILILAKPIINGSRFPLSHLYRFCLSDEHFCYKIVHTSNHTVSASYVFPLSSTYFTALLKRPSCFPCAPSIVLSVNTSLFKSCHTDYLPFLTELQPAIPINIMTKPKMPKRTVSVRLIVFKSVLPAVPMMMKSPMETTHSKSVFISFAPFYGIKPIKKHPRFPLGALLQVLVNER